MRLRIPVHPLARGALLAAGYFAAGRLGALASPPQPRAAAVWLAGGVALAGLVVAGARYWPAIAAGSLAFLLAGGVPLVPALESAVARAVVWGACAWVLAHRVGLRRGLSRVRDVLWFAAVGGTAALFCGTLGWYFQASYGAGPGPADWAVAALAGTVVLAPFVLAWRVRETPRPPGAWWELAAVVVLGAALAAGLFGSPQLGPADLPLTYLVFPLVGWAAMRLGTRGAASLSIAIAVVAMARVGGGLPAAFQRPSAVNGLLSLQAYVALVALGGLVLAALTSDRRRALLRERRARREAERAGRRQALLAEVGAVLSGTLYAGDPLHELARLCVAHLADGCIIDEVFDDGSYGAATTLHRDSRLTPVLAEMRRAYPPIANPNSRVDQVRRMRAPHLVRDVGPAYARAVAVDERHEELFRQLGTRSLVSVPVVARDRVVGVLTLVRTAASPRYGRPELALAEEVASRAALYVENARLHASVRDEGLVRKRVISMVAHEIRSPLSTILLSAGAVLSGSVPADDGKGCGPLHSIVVATEQVSRLLQDLTDVTLLEAGELPVERMAFSPATLLSEARMLLEPASRAASVRLETEVAGDAGPVSGDRERTLQVLGNLVSNATRFTGAGGVVSIRAERQGAEVRFCVSDTGMGMEPAALHGLLTPLWGGRPRKRGIGLPLSRAIVEAQGGRMWGESNPGAGSRIYFTLPAADAPAFAPAARALSSVADG